MKPIKTINVKVFAPGNKVYLHLMIRAPKGAAFISQGEEYALQNIAAQIEHQRPTEDYELKQIGRGEYNFVHVGTRQEGTAQS